MGEKRELRACAAAATSRRRFLQLTLGAAAASTGLLRGTAAQPSSSLTTTAIRDGLTLIGGAGGNAVLLRAGPGAVMVDSGTPERGADVAAFVRSQLGEQRLDALLNTHWHPAHTGGNDALAPTAAKVVAHENTRLWMSTEYYVDWEDKTYAPRAAAALPNATFYASDPQPLLLTVGDEHVEYGYLREAHTDGDIYVYFRERNVLVAGGAVAAGAYPVLDHATGGWIGGLVDANRKLLEITNANTLIVPHEGPAQPRAHLEAQLDMLVAVRERVENLMRKGRSIAEMLDADVTAGFDASWGSNRERFVANMYHGLWWAGRLDGSL
jgi:glyoxylase-like metal-dependent hydrolase (beta-lactamase superfamily II)